MPIVHDAASSSIDAATLYRILALRTDVFVVEQDCAYAELDGRDLEPAARQLWVQADDTSVLATLRLLTDAGGTRRIGRVATRTDARGSGLAGLLMTRALELCGHADVVLEAQSQLQGWYARFGFEVVGAEYVEDGIPHVPMRRPSALDPVSLGMQQHPEGGWYRETWRHPQLHTTARGERNLATCVAFLLQPGEASAWHRVASDELWLWQGGGTLRLTLGGSGDAPQPADPVDLSVGGQHLVPAGVWQTAEPAGDTAALVACVVAPGFEFADFELAP